MPCALPIRSEEHTSELQSHDNLVCRLLLEKNKRDARGPCPLREHGACARRPPHSAGGCMRPHSQPAALNAALGGGAGSRGFFFLYGRGPHDLPHLPPPPPLAS